MHARRDAALDRADKHPVRRQAGTRQDGLEKSEGSRKCNDIRLQATIRRPGRSGRPSWLGRPGQAGETRGRRHDGMTA
ncbi:unnamed protein product [Protopolystoma xenopodis]|uniref:Uncharacterized protein n=1 Tax=Protopolystoma xenopodis TaxID=117903 RepID=A0A3S5B4J9_9PLAT|nr:unnamed protein product [Protopolystoma xenopodis]